MARSNCFMSAQCSEVKAIRQFFVSLAATLVFLLKRS